MLSSLLYSTTWLWFVVFYTPSNSKQHIASKQTENNSTSVKKPVIYLIGGYYHDPETKRDHFSTVVYKVIPHKGVIERRSINSSYHGWMNAGTLDNNDIIFSSYHHETSGNTYGIYSTTDQHVTLLPHVPSVKMDFPSAVMMGPKFINCGKIAEDNKSLCIIYDTVYDTSLMVNIIGTKSSACMVDSGDHRHALWIGGVSNDGQHGVIKIDTVNGTYSSVAKFPSETRWGHHCTVLGDTVIICGGYIDYNPTGTCLSLYIPTMTWGTVASMRSNRMYFQMITLDDKILAIGDCGGEQRNEVYENGTWQYTPYKLPTHLCLFGSAVIKEEVHEDRPDSANISYSNIGLLVITAAVVGILIFLVIFVFVIHKIRTMKPSIVVPMLEIVNGPSALELPPVSTIPPPPPPPPPPTQSPIVSHTAQSETSYSSFYFHGQKEYPAENTESEASYTGFLNGQRGEYSSGDSGSYEVIID